MIWSAELDAALAAATRAAAYVLGEYASFVPIPDAPAEISTHADKAAQDMIVGDLLARFPADAVLAEEASPAFAGVPRSGPRCWVIDPIDGTRGFATKNDEFAVMIGFTLDGHPVLGVVIEPVAGRTTFASAGSGCWTRTGDGPPVRCRVSATADLAKSVLVKSHSKPGRPVSKTVAAIGPADVIETYSAGIKLALVARGKGDVYANTYPTVHDWDACAGHCLVEEAGGRVTDLRGRAVRYGIPNLPRDGLLATNGLAHDEVIRRIGNPVL
ncbi:MAG TPA: inositol monophosphatase family protein [Fimbriiglobus sp.]|jgi:3'-phosphoadenosine 5'-phosphosulfate (PAPS) 3'-phosphatase